MESTTAEKQSFLVKLAPFCAMRWIPLGHTQDPALFYLPFGQILTSPERPFTVKELTAKSRQFGEGGRKVPEFLPLSCQGGRENLPGTIGVKYKLIDWMQKSVLNL